MHRGLHLFPGGQAQHHSRSRRGRETHTDAPSAPIQGPWTETLAPARLWRRLRAYGNNNPLARLSSERQGGDAELPSRPRQGEIRAGGLSALRGKRPWLSLSASRQAACCPSLESTKVLAPRLQCDGFPEPPRS